MFSNSKYPKHRNHILKDAQPSLKLCVSSRFHKKTQTNSSPSQNPKQVRLRRRGILLCLLDHSFSSKKQPVKDGEATEGYVLDRPLSLMNIISQANIYLILCACTQPRILPKTFGNKVHSVSEANTCFFSKYEISYTNRRFVVG